jgi:hypothetical protein
MNRGETPDILYLYGKALIPGTKIIVIGKASLYAQDSDLSAPSLGTIDIRPLNGQ